MDFEIRKFLAKKGRNSEFRYIHVYPMNYPKHEKISGKCQIFGKS